MKRTDRSMPRTIPRRRSALNRVQSGLGLLLDPAAR